MVRDARRPQAYNGNRRILDQVAASDALVRSARLDRGAQKILPSRSIPVMARANPCSARETSLKAPRRLGDKLERRLALLIRDFGADVLRGDRMNDATEMSGCSGRGLAPLETHVAFLLSDLSGGGVQRVVTILAEAFQARGMRVDLVEIGRASCREGGSGVVVAMSGETKT